MAEDLSIPRETAPASTSAPPVTPATEAPRQHHPVYRMRFAFAYLALAVLAGVGIGASVLLVDRPVQEDEAWSAWRPQGSAATFDNQIADFVAARYRLPSSNPLVAVIPGPSSISAGEDELAIRGVVIQNDPQGDRDGDRVVDVGESRMYQLCGRGNQCSIAEGRPSEERMNLLRREALELALYTFKYVDGVDTVIALLPPNLGDAARADDDTAVALFFERRELANELERPLARTLFSPNPPHVAELDTRESLNIERLTGNRLFLYQFQPVQAGGAIMVLARPGTVE